MEIKKLEGRLFELESRKERKFYIEIDGYPVIVPENIRKLRAFEDDFDYPYDPPNEAKAGDIWFDDDFKRCTCLFFEKPFGKEIPQTVFEPAMLVGMLGQLEIFVLEEEKIRNFRLWNFEELQKNKKYEGLFDVYEEDEKDRGLFNFNKKDKQELLNTDFDLINFYWYKGAEHFPNLFEVTIVDEFTQPLPREIIYAFGSNEAKLKENLNETIKSKLNYYTHKKVLETYEVVLYFGKTFETAKKGVFGIGKNIGEAKQKAKERLKKGKLLIRDQISKQSKENSKIKEVSLYAGPDFSQGILGRGKTFEEALENAKKLNENIPEKGYKNHIRGIFEYETNKLTKQHYSGTLFNYRGFEKAPFTLYVHPETKEIASRLFLDILDPIGKNYDLWFFQGKGEIYNGKFQFNGDKKEYECIMAKIPSRFVDKSKRGESAHPPIGDNYPARLDILVLMNEDISKEFLLLRAYPENCKEEIKGLHYNTTINSLLDANSFQNDLNRFYRTNRPDLVNGFEFPAVRSFK